MGELCPVEVKGMTSSIVSGTAYFSMFLMVLIFPHMEVKIGIAGLFFTLSLICLAFKVYTIFCVPETKGLTMPQLQTLYDKGASAQDQVV